MVKCASLVRGDGKPEVELQVDKLKTVCFNPKIENPRTRCWKVTVPHVWKEMLKKDEFYPRGWSHRPFHHGGGRKQLEGNKRPRQEEAVSEETGVDNTKA